jgi:hypothetical protein
MLRPLSVSKPYYNGVVQFVHPARRPLRMVAYMHNSKSRYVNILPSITKVGQFVTTPHAVLGRE